MARGRRVDHPSSIAATGGPWRAQPSLKKRQ
jgi:hypothetical protein